jgi:alpha-1,3-rhamnosyl/mannosyltransferase
MAQQPYFLLVCNTYEYKNVKRILDAFEQLNPEFLHSLVIVGRSGDAEPEEWGPRIIRIEQCPAAYLAGLYQHSDVYVQPSLYEGSGVTVVEAMRAGTPVATSRTGGIPEFAGDTPIYFNPESVSSIVGAVRRAMEEDPQQRTNRVKFGKQVASEFTWERCAWKTLSAFKRA